jgi:hypothetical protein
MKDEFEERRHVGAILLRYTSVLIWELHLQKAFLEIEAVVTFGILPVSGPATIYSLLPTNQGKRWRMLLRIVHMRFLNESL